MKKAIVLGLAFAMATTVQARESAEEVLKAMRNYIGGTWTGQVKGENGEKLVVEFKYKSHPDGKGVIGEGIIGKGSKNPIYTHSQFGIDPTTKTVYYWDSHNSNTIYFGHVDLQDGALLFKFGPAGGDSNAFGAKSKLVDKDHFQNSIMTKDGREIVGLAFSRKRS